MDGQTDRISDIGEYRVAFATENGKKPQFFFKKQEILAKSNDFFANDMPF